ncbi:MAG: ABC transporter permease [Saprospiraceae bacterium]|nr:ABC transporter permease [Saprospiraceae bacterium]
MIQPPKRIVSFLKWFCDERFHEEMEGDLHEMYEDFRDRYGPRKAKQQFIKAAFSYMRPYFFRKRQDNSSLLTAQRFHFKIAFRYFERNKVFVLINVLGLALGVACALLINQLIQHESSFDQFHTGVDRTYRVVRVSQVEGADEFRTGVVFPMAANIRTDLPAAEAVTATYPLWNVHLAIQDEAGGVEKKFKERKGIGLVDESFFEVFDFGEKEGNWIHGEAGQALTQPYGMVLTASMARKYFGTTNPLGRIITIDDEYEFTVTGVVKDLPTATDLPFTVFLSFRSLEEMWGDFVKTSWVGVSDNSQCYLRLQEGVEAEAFNQQLAQLHAKHVSKEIAAMRSYLLQPMNEVHQDARFGNYTDRTTSQGTILVLWAIAFFVILTAGVNYINLATAQSSLRAKEMGMRKVVGSNRLGIMFQAFTETFLITSMAVILGLAMAITGLPYLEQYMDIQFQAFWKWEQLMWLLGLVLFMTIAAGYYPGKVLSGFSPIQAFRKKVERAQEGSLGLRRGLIVFQFVVAQLFIMATIAVLLQVKHFQEAEWGFNQDAVITVQVPGASDRPSVRQKLYNAWHSLPNIEQVSFAASAPSAATRAHNYSEIKLETQGPEDGIMCEVMTIDTAFIDLYEMPIVAGRSILPGEADQQHAVVVTERLAKDLGFLAPADAVDQAVHFNGRDCIIVGVAQDFQASSFRQSDLKHRGRVAMWHNPAGFGMASLRLKMTDAEQLSESLQAIEDIWVSTYPRYVFEFQFLDDRLAAYYAVETKMSQLFRILAAIAIFIGCLGLYGLVTFLVNQKTKEIGVRKVLGASTQQILSLILKEYVGLLLLAFLIACPIAYWGLNQWLNNFASQIDLPVWLFIAALAFSMTMAILSVGYKSLQAARLNPAKALRTE